MDAYSRRRGEVEVAVMLSRSIHSPEDLSPSLFQLEKWMLSDELVKEMDVYKDISIVERMRGSMDDAL